jgi:rod shape-determining protein MreB
VVGKALAEGLPRRVEITAGEVREALGPTTAEIAGAVRKAVETLSADAAADIYEAGVLLTGGGVLVDGMAEFLGGALGLQAAVSSNALVATVLGTGCLLARPDRLHRAVLRDRSPISRAGNTLAFWA